MSEENENLKKIKEINISVDNSNVEKLIKRNFELEEKLREKNSGSGGMGSEEFTEEAEFERKLRLLNKGLKKVEQEDALNEAEENGYDVKDSGKGTLPLTKEQKRKEGNYSGDGKEFSSHAELVSHLKSEIRKGNETAKQQYVELVNKCMKGLQEKSVVWQDGENGESMISYTLNERNKRLREQLKKSKGD